MKKKKKRNTNINECENWIARRSDDGYDNDKDNDEPMNQVNQIPPWFPLNTQKRQPFAISFLLIDLI